MATLSAGRQGLSPRAPGVDFNVYIEIYVDFAPVSKFATLRSLLAVAAVVDMEIHRPFTKTAFLNGVLKEDVYVEGPAGYEEDGRDCGRHLHKALYGLKQAPRACYSCGPVRQ